MSWERIDVVFKLKSPLHIGYMPYKGSVISPTRYYVPGRNFWGAVTKNITEHLYNGTPHANDYKKAGKFVMETFRFSYFYLFDGKTIYFPCYTDDGLMYGEKGVMIPSREFEHKFIGSTISTEIDTTSGTAREESLHEIEFINNRFRNKIGDFQDTKIIGSIWVKENARIDKVEIEIRKTQGIFIKDLNIIEELIVGGESKYGFGHIKLNSLNEKNPIEVEDNRGELKIKIEKNKPLPAHLKFNPSIQFRGDIELLTGRGYFDPQNSSKSSNKPGRIVFQPEYCFSPGSVIINLNEYRTLNWDGSIL